MLGALEIINNNEISLPPATIILFIFVIALVPLIIPVLFTTILSAALFIFLYRTCRNKLLLALPILPYISALIVLQNPLYALEATVFFPVGMAVIFMLERKSSRIQTVIAGSAAYIVFYVLFIALTLVVNAQSLDQYFTEQLEPFSEFLTEDLVNQMLLIMPATLICFVNVFSYVITALYRALAHLFKLTYQLPDVRWELKLSIVSAYVFCVTYVISILGGSTIYGVITAAITVVTQNVILILTPGFAYQCVSSLIRRFKNRENTRLTIIICVFAFFLMFVSPGMIVTMLAFFGVADAIITQHSINRNKG